MAPRVAPFALGLGVSAVLCLPFAIQAADALPATHIAQATEALRPKLVELRRDFHRHPELAFHEERTAGIVAERLRALGFDEVRTNVTGHGVVALLNGAQPGLVVAVRADMDALPITETNHQPYCSTVPGVMHACGHDAHTAIALGVAEVLSQMRGQLAGSVKFLFQPAEESTGDGELSGAPVMIREGALEHPRPVAVFGLHTSPELETGVVGYHSGPAQAAIDVFDITIHGKAAAGVSPQQGVDAVVVAAEAVSALQTIRSRRLNPLEPAVLTVGMIQGGASPFSTPAEVKFQGSVRALNGDVRTRMAQMVRETLEGVTAAHSAGFDLQFHPVTAVLVNDPKLVEAALPSLRRALGAARVVEVPTRMGGEDFAYYGQVVPAFFLRLGSGNRSKGITAVAHTAAFDVDEDCLVTGVKALAALVVDFLDRQTEAH